jgi:hypothetical protein
MKLIEEIKLDNGLKLKIYDLSRAIANDTIKVEIFFQTIISLKESFFTDVQDYIQIKNAICDEYSNEHRLERSFVSKDDEDSVRNDLISTFKNNSLNYFAAVNFPLKMAHSKLREIKKNPHKYKSRAKSDQEK